MHISVPRIAYLATVHSFEIGSHLLFNRRIRRSGCPLPTVYLIPNSRTPIQSRSIALGNAYNGRMLESVWNPFCYSVFLVYKGLTGWLKNCLLFDGMKCYKSTEKWAIVNTVHHPHMTAPLDFRFIWNYLESVSLLFIFLRTAEHPLDPTVRLESI